ncbi:hypothetical protein [Nostoc favosum]|nr:hypothetical protein [Nostoc favosum]
MTCVVFYIDHVLLKKSKIEAIAPDQCSILKYLDPEALVKN